MERIANVTVERDVAAKMRDGTTLYADVYRPDGPGPFPVILMRLPYDKTQAQQITYAHPSWYARHGYLVVIQDVRGRWKSEGTFYPFRHEMTDGYDTVEWVAGLKDSNGKVGMYGFSYPGATQLLAAVMAPPHLTCICPALTSSQHYDGWSYNAGAFALAFNLSWALFLATDTVHRDGLIDLERNLWSVYLNLPGHYGYLPLSEFPLLKESNIAPYFFDWLNHPSYDDYWKQSSIDERYHQVAVPALHIGGWYDIFRDGTLKNFAGIRDAGAGEVARRSQRLLMGPWYHIPWAQFTGQLDFGDDARSCVDAAQLRWFDHWLKGADNGVMEEAPVRVFVMGDNVWREEAEWPPTTTRYAEFYLHSEGRANSLNGDGRVDQVRPEDEPPDVYTYDPRLPVPSLGGHSCCVPTVAPMGPADQRPAEVMNQVLVYTTDVLSHDVSVIGAVTLTLWASSSAVDTDFTGKLVDVYPDGRAINLTEGILRATFRESLETTVPLIANEVYCFSIQLGNCGCVFKAGHRIRLEVSSSNFPHWDRNANTGNRLGADSYGDLQVATQQVFHDGERPSHVTLPVVD